MDEPTKDPTRETVLVLRTCAAGRVSHNGFVWPESGYVEAPDWQPTAACGNGLHGWLRGEGDGTLGYFGLGALGLVVETYADHIIDLNGKVKFPYGWVVYCGQFHEAARIVAERYPDARVVFAALTGGNESRLTGGNNSKLIGGVGSMLTGGHHSTLTGGDYSTLIGGDYSRLTGGHYSTLIGGDYSTLTGGNYSKLTGGIGSAFTVRYGEADHRRIAVAEVGKNGIEPNMPYRLDEDGVFVKDEL